MQLNSEASPKFVCAMIAIMAALVLATSGCSIIAKLFDKNPEPLEVVVPPCIEFPGSGVDPCRQRGSWDDFTPHISTSYEFPDVVPTLSESLADWGDDPWSAYHFVVRATAVPRSVRCAPPTPIKIYYMDYLPGYDDPTRHMSFCYVDLAINEFLVGDGPTRLTVGVTRNPRGCYSESEVDEDCLLDGAKQLRATGIERVEWIMFLGGPFYLGQGGWDVQLTYDVQGIEDGDISVVNYFKGKWLSISKPEHYETNASRLEHTLDEFRDIVREAFAERVASTSGRTGIGVDRHGRPPPKLATDAGRDGFNDFMMRTGFMEGTPVPPPPYLGEFARNLSGQNVNDIIATRVAGGTKIPGGLENVATAGPLSDDAATATSTAEPTATKTGTAEPTVTPEPAPTPEQVATRRLRPSMR